LTHAQKGLNQEDHNSIQHMDLDAGFGTNDDTDVISHTIPPGEEGLTSAMKVESLKCLRRLLQDLQQQMDSKEWPNTVHHFLKFNHSQISCVDDQDRFDRVEIQTNH
jgi:hypothetical protein